SSLPAAARGLAPCPQREDCLLHIYMSPTACVSRRLLSWAAILEMNGNLSCRCVKTTSEYISPKRYESLEIRPVGSTCRIKLRTSSKVCVNPEALWVKKLLKRIAGT
uniref:Chemokine interleukin-8-like domain-containing protein n=1 Tax=Nothoprocta perdicaria TaxID=30464 RepID=A0A8C6ZHW1_NOTPE